MPTGTPGDDLFTASTGNESFDGDAGVDTVSYLNSGTGVYVNLETGQSTPLLKIMPFGDSITYGIISTGTVKDKESGGYRVYLWDSLLQTQDLAIDYVGSIQSGPLNFPDRDHAGFGGETIDYLNSVDEGLLNTYKPDVILLMIGTNDSQIKTADQMISDLRSLLISIATNAPGVTIFVAAIPPNHDAEENAVAQQYNAMIPGLVAELGDTHSIIFVDTSDLTLDDITPPPIDSGVHPTAAGYEKLAGLWLDAIIDSGLFEDERDTLASIENVTGSNFGDKLVGDGASNVLSGLVGNDQLIGGAGNDTLDGGAGSDTLTGGIGDDTYIVDSSSDVILEGAGEGNDSIRTTKTTYSLANLPNVENLTYTGASAAKLTGNSADNRIEGGSGNDTLDGGTGVDTMAGGKGADTYVVDNVADVIVEAASSGVDTVKASVSFTLAANVEKLTLTGTGAIDGTGNNLANTITGNAAANKLSGGSANDTLIGGGGDDHLFGGYGADILRGGAGTDFLTGDSGADKFDWDNVGDAGIGAARDQVLDFVRGTDKLDLSTIDARTNVTGNNAFSFIGTGNFSGTAGQLRAERVGEDTVVQGDVNGDGVADFEIVLVAYTANLQSSDFIL
jgi:Ca2+-binding RTX toxin-like protein